MMAKDKTKCREIRTLHQQKKGNKKTYKSTEIKSKSPHDYEKDQNLIINRK